MTIGKQILTVNEAATYAGVGRNTLRNLINGNKISIIKVGNKIIIRAETLDKFLRENEGKNLRCLHEVIAV